MRKILWWYFADDVTSSTPGWNVSQASVKFELLEQSIFNKNYFLYDALSSESVLHKWCKHETTSYFKQKQHYLCQSLSRNFRFFMWSYGFVRNCTYYILILLWTDIFFFVQKTLPKLIPLAMANVRSRDEIPTHANRILLWFRSNFIRLDTEY